MSGTSPETGGPFGAAHIARSINPTAFSHQLVPDLGTLWAETEGVCARCWYPKATSRRPHRQRFVDRSAQASSSWLRASGNPAVDDRIGRNPAVKPSTPSRRSQWQAMQKRPQASPSLLDRNAGARLARHRRGARIAERPSHKPLRTLVRQLVGGIPHVQAADTGVQLGIGPRLGSF